MANKHEELQAQIDALTRLLEERGIRPPEKFAIRPEDRKDYIPFGSPAHRDYLGLIEVDDIEDAKEAQYVIYTSPNTNKTYRLADEIGASIHYPGVDLEKAAHAVLRQKVSSYEAGPPEPPPDAPPMWPLEPVEMPIY